MDGTSSVQNETRASTFCRLRSGLRDHVVPRHRDAVYQNIDIIESYAPQYMVLAGDHIYKMDYEKMLQQHVESKADVTVGCLEASLEEAKGFGSCTSTKKTPSSLPGEAC